jgi:hypothetical protein
MSTRTTQNFTEAINDFYVALDAAIVDKTLESNGQRIDYYYDADLVFRLVKGFRLFKTQIVQTSRRQLVVGSLLSAGFLSKVRMLRPHALELDANIRIWASEVGRTGIFREEAAQFFQEWGIREAIEEVLAIIGPEPKRQDNLLKVFDKLRQVAGETFVALELASGPWERRLKRLVLGGGGDGLLSFDGISAPLAQLMSSKAFKDIDKIVRSEASGKRSEFSNIRDTAALSMLHAAINERAESARTSQVPLVRFYTETPTLIAAWEKSKRLQEYLRYPHSKHGKAGNEHSRSVWRSATYFLIRAIFPALGFARNGGSLDGGLVLDTVEPEITLDELTEVCRSLGEIPDLQGTVDTKTRERLEEIRIGNQLLAEFLQELEDLSFLKRVFLRYRPSVDFADLIQEIEEIWNFAGSDSALERLEEEIRLEVDQLREELREEVAEFGSWLRAYKNIVRKVDRLQKKMAKYDCPDLLRDFGLIRWGFHSPPDGLEERLESFWEQFSSRADDDRSSAAAELASRVVAPPSREDCLIGASYLWFFGLFSLVAECIQTHLDRGGEEDYSLEVWRSAAIVRSSPEISREERRAVISGLQVNADIQDGEERGTRLLGLAYVLYYCWIQERRGSILDSTPPPRDDELDHWVEESFESAREAFRSLREGTVARAFALNHCVYVGSVARVREGELTGLAQQLSTFMSSEEWNYRFADTLSYRQYLRAVREFNALGKDMEAQDRLRLCGYLTLAIDFIEQAVGGFSDDEIKEHKLQIAELQADLNCRGVEGNGS